MDWESARDLTGCPCSKSLRRWQASRAPWVGELAARLTLWLLTAPGSLTCCSHHTQLGARGSQSAEGDQAFVKSCLGGDISPLVSFSICWKSVTWSSPSSRGEVKQGGKRQLWSSSRHLRGHLRAEPTGATSEEDTWAVGETLRTDSEEKDSGGESAVWATSAGSGNAEGNCRRWPDCGQLVPCAVLRGPQQVVQPGVQLGVSRAAGIFCTVRLFKVEGQQWL